MSGALTISAELELLKHAKTAARSPQMRRERKAPDPVRRFLAAGAQELRHAGDGLLEPTDPAQLPARIFEIQTHREFCYLSKTRVQRYRSAAESWIERWVKKGEPVRYFLDIGGGYHASLRPGFEGLCFDVGVGEWLLLLQIHRFNQRIKRVYGQGARFTLIVDDLCAHLVNDIELASTSAYCARLRDLIRRLGLCDDIDVFVESEQFTLDQFKRLQAPKLDVRPPGTVSAKERETVERFLGRGCDLEEAATRIAKYREITAISARLTDNRIGGVHMTQRATPDTICFRAFPGGATRIQNGQVALQSRDAGDVRPFLLTSHNERAYDWDHIDCSDLSPAGLDRVIFATLRDGAHDHSTVLLD